nr:uncharacterized protein CI109_006304 [Kwoniella shandongensis]KAA5525325.1 hypothetical protein CI109_006304 [Kwoniella shandongensis]
MPVSKKRSSASQSNTPVPWTPPSQEEFQALKRYKSFLLPPNNSYALGEFVWLPHEGSRPSSYVPPPRPKKIRRRSPSQGTDGATSTTTNTNTNGENGTTQPQEEEGETELDEFDPEEIQKESDARWAAGFWLGRIVEIRARDTSYVWLKVRWMCRNVKELRDQGIKTGLPKGKVGGKEVYMLGPEYDALQPVGAVEGRAQVILFDETNPMQEPFDERAIFYRSEARIPTPIEAEQLFPKRITTGVITTTKGKRKSETSNAPSGHLFNFRQPTCYCGQGYLPLSDHPETMALCPHPDCLKWFHLGCLDWKDLYRRTPTPTYIEQIKKSGLELLSFPNAAIGPTDPKRSLTAGQGPSDSSSGSTSTTQHRPQAKDEEDPEGKSEMVEIDSTTLAELKEVDSHLPENIRLAAQIAITRGPGVEGIVGNATKVVRAREILLKNREERGVESTKTELDTGDAKQAEERGELGKLIKRWQVEWGSEEMELERAVIWLCPSCQRPM